MASTSRLFAFAATAFVVIVVPGPSVLFAVGRAMASGRRVAVLSVLGNALGEYAQVVAIGLGIGALVEHSVAAFTVLKLVGGAYLVYLGAKAFRDRRSLAAAVAAPQHASRSDPVSFLQGLTVGATNPKTIVFLAAILPQFVSSAGDATGQILLLGLIFATIAAVSDTVWVLAASTFRAWFARSPRRLEMVGGFGGLSIAAVGATFLVSGRKG
jgi:threonine/homoserine/homoserine lactone efflux protein